MCVCKCILPLPFVEVLMFVRVELKLCCGVLAVFHLLTQFGRAVTYNTFVALGLITSVPASAGKFTETRN